MKTYGIRPVAEELKYDRDIDFKIWNIKHNKYDK